MKARKLIAKLQKLNLEAEVVMADMKKVNVIEPITFNDVEYVVISDGDIEIEIEEAEYLDYLEKLAEILMNKGEVVFDTKEYTVYIQESSNEFDVNLYPLGTKPDEDGEFDDDLLLDGGIVQDGDELDAIIYAYEF